MHFVVACLDVFNFNPFNPARRAGLKGNIFT